MKSVAYASPFVPPEWIAAHGLRPELLIPDTSYNGAFAGEGVCPYARMFMQSAASNNEVSACIFTTTCDQMRRGAERLTQSCECPVFLMNVPATWQSENARSLYRRELERLGSFLVEQGGGHPAHSELVSTLTRFDAARSQVQSRRNGLSARQYAEQLASIHPDGLFPILPGPSANGLPLALIGGPLSRQHYGLFDIIEQAGGSVVLNATTGGERTLPKAFNLDEMAASPLDTLVAAYFGTIPDAFRRPNTALYAWLEEKIEERNVAGIVVHRYLWCDLWQAEAQRIKQWAQVPVFVLDAADDGLAENRSATRIQAFIETLL